MHTLIAFLGKGRRGGLYETANYRFDDGSVATEPYFALALARRLRPAELLLVGTSGSAWDVFFGREAAAGQEDLLALMEAVEAGAVGESLLDVPARLLGDKLGIRVSCLLIDQARDEAAQANVLLELAARLPHGTRVVLDVTHAFRHLPMLALVAARYLAKLRSVTVEDIYYGALEMTVDELTPVLRLGGLLRMLDWVDALSAYEHGGDYGVFAPLLEAEGLDSATVRALSLASFNERVNNSEGAKQALTLPLKEIATLDGPLASLFRDELGARLSWARGDERGKRELGLAHTWLQRGDYLRASIFLQEGLITSEAYRLKSNHNDRDDRERARESLKGRLSQFKKLEYLRNALAHGQRSPDGEVDKLIKDEATLRQRLSRLLDTLPAAAAKA